MQRARRLASVAVVATLAVAGLSACRSDSSVAAYVGDTEITEARVQALWDETSAALAGATGRPAAMPITRGEVVRTLLSVDVLAQVARKRGVTLPADLPLGDYAGMLRLPETTEFVRLYATVDTYVKLLRTKVQSAPEPTDAELREVFDVLVASGMVGPTDTFAQFKSQLPPANKELVQTATAVRREITEAADPLRVRVNPRYQPMGIPVLQFQTQDGALRPLVVAPLGPDETTPVTDVS